MDKAETWVELLNLRLVEKGGNVSMVLPYGKRVFYGVTQVGGVDVVSKANYAAIFLTIQLEVRKLLK